MERDRAVSSGARAGQARAGRGAVAHLLTKPWVAEDVFHLEPVGWGVTLAVLRDGTNKVRTRSVDGNWLASDIMPGVFGEDDVGAAVEDAIGGGAASAEDHATAPMVQKVRVTVAEEEPLPPPTPPPPTLPPTTADYRL